MKRLGQFGAIAFFILLLVAGIIVLVNKGNGNREEKKEKSNNKLESFYKNKFEYDDAFRKILSDSKEQVIAGIVSHHFLAKDLIAQFFSGIDTKEVQNVYIVGPDHYESLFSEEYDLATSFLDWQTPYGVFHSNQPIIDHMLNNLGAGNDNTIFRNEHSVYTLIPFAKKVFPNARVIPLVLKSSKDYQKFFNLGKKSFKDKSLLIVSTDFSHQVSEDQAIENDINSIKSLASMNFDSIDTIKSDCNQCIAFLYGFISNESSRFRLVDNKTSSDFGSQDEQNLTSYISGYFVPNDIRILFGGDVMFDRYIRQVANDKGYNFIFQEIAGHLLDKDLVVVNLEGPITPFDSMSIRTEIGTRNNYVFTFDPDVINTLLEYNIKVANIGNNHILDFGQAGLNQTKQLLSSNDINYFGNTGMTDNSMRSSIIELKGKKIAFVNYNQFVDKGLETTLDDINQLKDRTDFIIIYTHWGNEYTKSVTQPLRKAAHQLIDAGADLIIGSHPHVVQEKEVYQEKTIYYSLGNFVFDQYFSEDTQKGLLVELVVDIESNEINFHEYPIILLQNGQTILAN